MFITAVCVLIGYSFSLFINVKIATKLNLEQSDLFEKEILKRSRCGLRSPYNAGSGHFHVVVFQRTTKKGKRNVSRFSIYHTSE